MITGIGNDIIEICRIEKAIERHGETFLNKIFTADEQAYCNGFADSCGNYAGRFAAKEAIVKALGSGFQHGITWLDIEIQKDPLGKPIVCFSDKIISMFGDVNCLLSISHCRSYATAMAVICGK